MPKFVFNDGVRDLIFHCVDFKAARIRLEDIVKHPGSLASTRRKRYSAYSDRRKTCSRNNNSGCCTVFAEKCTRKFHART